MKEMVDKLMVKEYFTIGELSELFNINTQTLRYYDSIGLFSPERRDEDTGYRYYRFNQLYELASIRYLRRLDYSINNIDSYMKSRKVDLVLDKFKEQSRLLHEKWDELMRIDNVIQRKISFIESELPRVKIDNYDIRYYDDRKYIAIGSEEQLYKSDTFYFYPTIAFYKGKDKSFGAYIMDETTNSIAAKSLMTIPSGKYVCGYHKGPFDKLPDTIEKLNKFADKLKLENESIHFNIIDQFVESDTANYITGVQIRIVDDTKE